MLRVSLELTDEERKDLIESLKNNQEGQIIQADSLHQIDSIGSEDHPYSMKDYDEDRPPTICVDLDGTILEYDGWKGPDHFGEPLPGAYEALSNLKAAGWLIIIYTTRGNEEDVAMQLKKHNLPFHYINYTPYQPPGSNAGKPIADVYLDDRAIRFENWQQAVCDIFDLDDNGAL